MTRAELDQQIAQKKLPKLSGTQLEVIKYLAGATSVKTLDTVMMDQNLSREFAKEIVNFFDAEGIARKKIVWVTTDRGILKTSEWNPFVILTAIGMAVYTEITKRRMDKDVESTYTVIGLDGKERTVTAEEFQAAIDRDLAAYNNGVLPTTDAERQQIIEKIKMPIIPEILTMDDGEKSV